MGRHVNKPPKSPDDGKTGYRNPPKEHQFPKGKSGNPKGRPPGSKGLRTDLKKVLGTVRTVEINGKRITGTTQYLMLEAMGMRGSHGDVKAFLALIPYILQAFGFEDRDVNNDWLSAGDKAILMRVLGRRAGEAANVPAAKRSPRSKPAKRKPARKAW